MDLILVKKYEVKRQKNDRYWMNYGFGSTKKKVQRGKKSMGIEQTMDLKSVKKKRG